MKQLTEKQDSILNPELSRLHTYLLSRGWWLFDEWHWKFKSLPCTTSNIKLTHEGIELSVQRKGIYGAKSYLVNELTFELIHKIEHQTINYVGDYLVFDDVHQLTSNEYDSVWPSYYHHVITRPIPDIEITTKTEPNIKKTDVDVTTNKPHIKQKDILLNNTPLRAAIERRSNETLFSMPSSRFNR
jgi:hypothetical protein